MKVLHVYKTYLPDSFTGTERVIWELAEGTARQGVESHVLSLSATPSDGPLPIGQHTAHAAKLDAYLASTGLSFSAFGMFRRLAASADLIHYHFPWPMMDLLHLAAGQGTPSLATYHSDIVRQKTLARFYGPLMHRFLSAMDAIVATSPQYARSSATLQRYRDRTTVIPIGIGEPAERPGSARISEWRQRLGDGFFLFVGALRYYKGLPFLMRAAAASGLPVVIVGDGEFAQDIRSAGLPNVTMLGHLPEVDKLALLELCRAFVLPSHLRSEAFGVVLLEAARAGRPIISCEIGTGTSHVNVDGVTGLTVPPGDPLALAAAMQRLADDEPLAQVLGAGARARYLEHFTVERMAGAYLSLYRAVAERGVHGQPARPRAAFRTGLG